MHRSLPMLDGTVSLPGLSAPVTIQRDRLGVVTIDAANEIDAMRALGYVHAQERFFEMDLMRRSAAGELAGLFGADRDRYRQGASRASHARTRACATWTPSPATGARNSTPTSAGVNAGLGDLAARPWPYLLLRSRPRAWQRGRHAAGRIRDVLRPAGFDQQARTGAVEDPRRRAAGVVRIARARRQQLGCAARWAPRAATPCCPMPRRWICGACRCRRPRALAMRRPEASAKSAATTSPCHGARTRDGRAIVADDMHLGLRVPNIWFRARLRYADRNAPGGRVDVVGVHPARPAAGGGRQQPPCRLGLHQQLCGCRRLGGRPGMSPEVAVQCG